MLSIHRLASTALSWALTLSLASAQSAVVDFDGTTEPCTFISTGPLTTQLIGMGVEFHGPSGPGGLDGGAVLDQCSSFGVTGHSLPNFLAFNTGTFMSAGGVPWGPETILFTPAVSGVQIMAGSGITGGNVTLECFAGATMLGSDSVPIQQALQPLLVPAAGIDRCVITFTGTTLVVDDLAFNFGPPPPACTLTLPLGPVMDDVDVTVDSMSSSSPTVDVTIEFSTDAGATFLPATMAVGSPNPNPAPGTPTGMALFLWDSRGDLVGTAMVAIGVIVRATVDDGTPAAGQCEDSVDVDNTILCNGICGDCDLNGLAPDVLDALAAAQVAAALIMPTAIQVACCDVNASGFVDVLDALGIAQEAAGIPVTLTCV